MVGLHCGQLRQDAGEGGRVCEVPRPEQDAHALALPSPQASAYLKQNKYQQAEELYKEILSQEALPAPLGEPPSLLPRSVWRPSPHLRVPSSTGAPHAGTAGDAQQQVGRLHRGPGRAGGGGPTVSPPCPHMSPRVPVPSPGPA